MATPSYISNRIDECKSAFVKIDWTKPICFDFFVTNLNNLIHWIKEVDSTLFNRVDIHNRTMIQYYISNLKYILLPTTIIKIIEEYRKIDKIFDLAYIDGYSNVNYPSNYSWTQKQLIEAYNKYLNSLNSVYNSIYVWVRDLTDLTDIAFDFGKASDKYLQVLTWNDSQKNPARDFSGYTISLLNKDGEILQTKVSPNSGICLFNLPSSYDSLKIKISKGNKENTYHHTNLSEQNKIAIIYINFDDEYSF